MPTYPNGASSTNATGQPSWKSSLTSGPQSRICCHQWRASATSSTRRPSKNASIAGSQSIAPENVSKADTVTFRASWRRDLGSPAGEPELDFRGVHLEACGVRLARGDLVPIAGPIANLPARHLQDELALRDHAAVRSLVSVRLDDGARGVRREQNLAAFGRESIGVEGPVERWQGLDAVG